MADPGRPLTKMESIRNLINGNVSDLSGLATTGKTSLVEAVNEIVSGMGAIISDTITSTWTTWSSSKLTTELNKKASSANAVFTGTVTVPNNSLSIPKVSGLQTSLDGKRSVIDPSNVVSGTNATVSGGINNKAQGQSSVVPGGSDNQANSLYSTASGNGGLASIPGARVYGSKFSSAGDAQDIILNLKDISTTEVSVVLKDESGVIPSIPQNTTWAISGVIVARRTDGAQNEDLYSTFTYFLKRGVGSTAVPISPSTIVNVSKNVGNVWYMTVAYTIAGALYIRCYGEAGKTIRWLANLRIVQISN